MAVGAGLAALQAGLALGGAVAPAVQRAFSDEHQALKKESGAAADRIDRGGYKGISTAQQRGMLGTALKEGAHITPGLTQSALGPASGTAAMQRALTGTGDRLARAKLGGEIAAKSSALAQQKKAADVALVGNMQKQKAENTKQLVGDVASAGMDIASLAVGKREETRSLAEQAERADKADKQTMADIGYEGSLEEWQALTDEDRAAKVQGSADAAAAAEATAKEEAAAATKAEAAATAKADTDASTYGVASAADPAAISAEWSRVMREGTSSWIGPEEAWAELSAEDRKKYLSETA